MNSDRRVSDCGPGVSEGGRRPIVGRMSESADGISSDTAQAALRADIRRLGNLLGESLVRQEGPELLDLVEEVRGAAVVTTPTRAGGGATPAGWRPCSRTSTWTPPPGWCAPSAPTSTSPTSPSRCTGPASCARERAGKGGWLAQARRADPGRGLPPSEIAALVDRLAVRPVFTAHPTEAARRSILSKRRRVAELLERPRRRADPAHDRRLAEVIDLLWQTDELRLDRPEPSTRRATRSTTSTS